MKFHKIIAASLLGISLSACDGGTKQETDVTQEEAPVKGLELTSHNLTLKLDANSGGRIEGIYLNGQNFLTGQEINEDNWGSTFWPSPQSAWGWPPSAELDKDAYEAVQEDGLIRLTSKKDPKLGYVFVKSFEADNSDTSFVITYTIENKSDQPTIIAPWEISRVAPKGLTFFPTGKGAKRGDLVPLIKDTIGITWFSYNGDLIPEGVPKLIADGSEGWMAQVNGDHILIKKFKDISEKEAAPEEGEIELYANPDKSYIEIEQQGAYETIKAGESSSWEVKWYLRKLPEGISSSVGNQELADYVRKIVK